MVYVSGLLRSGTIYRPEANFVSEIELFRYFTSFPIRLCILHCLYHFLAHCVSSTAHKNNRTSGGRTFLCCSPCCFGLSKDTKTSTTTYKPAAKSNNHNSNENNTKAVHNNNPFIGGGKENSTMYYYLFHTMTFSRKKLISGYIFHEWKNYLFESRIFFL